jgi:predicted secreted protein
MTTEAVIGYGTLFQIFEDPVWTTLGEVTSITLPSLQRDAVEATHMQSPDAWREFIPGLKNAGEVKIEMNFVPASATDEKIRATFATNTVPQFRIALNTPASPTEAVIFSGIVTNYEVTGPLADKMAATLTVKVSGAVTWGNV